MYVDKVNGVIIGEVMIVAALHSPSGTQYGNKRSFSTETDAREWAEATRRAVMAEVGEAESRRLGWGEPWELRIYV